MLEKPLGRGGFHPPTLPFPIEIGLTAVLQKRLTSCFPFKGSRELLISVEFQTQDETSKENEKVFFFMVVNNVLICVTGIQDLLDF